MTITFPEQMASRVTQYESRDAWLAGRTLGIGASDVAAIMGVSPWSTPLDVWNNKRGRAAEHSDATLKLFARGHALEESVVRLYSIESGREALHLDDCTVTHPTLPWAYCSPDGLVLDGDVGGLEAKTSGRADSWSDSVAEIMAGDDYDPDTLPPVYALQVYWSLECCGLPWWDLAALLPFLDVKVVRIHADRSTQDVLVQRVTEWYERHIIGDVPPDPSTSEEIRRWAAQQFQPRKGDPLTEPDDETAESIRNLWALKDAAKAAETQAKAIHDDLLVKLGDSPGFSLDGSKLRRITRKPSQRLDSKALRAEHPDLVASFTHEVGTATSYLQTYGRK